MFRLRYIHCAMVSSFILPCFPFFFDWWMIRWEITEEVLMNCTYYVTLMAKYTCPWLHHLLKLLTSAMFCCGPIQVNQDGFMLRLLCFSLGCDLPIQLLLKSLSSMHEDIWLVYHFHHVLIHVTNYEIRNNLCLNK